MIDVLDSPSLPLACGFLNSDRRELSKASLSVDYHICVSKEGLLKRKILFQSQVLERFPYFWSFVFWEVCGGNDVEGRGVYFWWPGFVLSVWFSLMGEKGTFKREELDCVLEWPSGKVSKCCTFFFPLVLGKKIVFRKSYSASISSNSLE